jgi:chemotaxis protein CheX
LHQLFPSHDFQAMSAQTKFLPHARIEPSVGPDACLNGLVAGIAEFFAQDVNQAAEFSTPYLGRQSKVDFLEFALTLRVAGPRRGTVHFTASRAMLTIMLMRMGCTDIGDQAMGGALAQLATRMTAAVRRTVDNRTVVSAPTIRKGRPTSVDCGPSRPLFVPIQWRKYSAQLLVCMQ